MIKQMCWKKGSRRKATKVQVGCSLADNEPITSTIMKVETREVKKEMTYFPIRILSEKNYSLTTLFFFGKTLTA